VWILFVHISCLEWPNIHENFGHFINCCQEYGIKSENWKFGVSEDQATTFIQNLIYKKPPDTCAQVDEFLPWQVHGYQLL